ncbi:hypothetical protein, partial [Nocardia cyriacigeorgica]|uniref:hypothetical protein n=1 Tax=Nocardia cyriacigeorgica TaxID=135487 RepID=UPI0024569DEA
PQAGRDRVHRCASGLNAQFRPGQFPDRGFLLPRARPVLRFRTGPTPMAIEPRDHEHAAPIAE